MKRLCLLLALWGLPAWGQDFPDSTGGLPPFAVRVQANEVHGLLYCLESLRGEAHHSPQLAKVFRERRGAHPEDGPPLDAFRLLVERSGWAYLRLSGDGERQRRIDDVLEAMALQSSNPEDFLTRSAAVLNLRESECLRVAVRHYAPLYRELIWDKERVELFQQADALCAQLETLRVGVQLRRAGDFYNTQWPPEREFVVALTPLPRKPEEKVVCFGHSDGFLEVVEVPSGTDVRTQAGVIFHEICHSLWNVRAQAWAEGLREAFAREGPWGRWAYAQLNESMATALGNGWFQAMTGLDGGKSWYDDEIIDGYARALFPEVKARLQDGRKLDADFAGVAVARFRERFPGAKSDVSIQMREIVIVSDRRELQEGGFQNRVAALGPMRSIWVIAPARLEEARTQHPDATFLLIGPESGGGRCQERGGHWEIGLEGTPDEILATLARVVQGKTLKAGPIASPAP